MAGEPIHTDGGKHQVDLERGGGDFCGVVAVECFRAISFDIAHSRRVTSRQETFRRGPERFLTGEQNLRRLTQRANGA